MFDLLDLTPMWEFEISYLTTIALEEFQRYEVGQGMGCQRISLDRTRHCIRNLGHYGPHFCNHSREWPARGVPRIMWW